MAALQTEAVLDVLTDEWVIHTPVRSEGVRHCTAVRTCGLPLVPHVSCVHTHMPSTHNDLSKTCAPRNVM